MLKSRFDATPLTWFFACPQFIEPLLANELTSLGAQQVKIGHAGVQAQGDLTFAYTALLWSRLAFRATLQLASGFGKNQQELLVLLQNIPWEKHLRENLALNGFKHDPYRRYRFIQDNVLVK